MRKLSILVVVAVAISAGAAHAGTKAGSFLKSHVPHLTPEEQTFVQERHASVTKTLDKVKKLQRQKARELRTKRRLPLKR